MVDTAERFVAEWIGEHVGTSPVRKVKPDAIEALTLKLMEDAWEFGLTRKQFLDAVGGDAFEFVLFEVEKIYARASPTRRGSNSPPRSPA